MIGSSEAEAPTFTLARHAIASPGRASVEAFLEAQYEQAFAGRIRAHYPVLMAATGPGGQVLAAAGYRRAQGEALFLEPYLDAPVEAVVGHELDRDVTRAEIAEIGNLASVSPCAARALFLALADHLRSLGCTLVVATATRQLRRSFTRLNFPVRALARADAARLPGAGADWGGYYRRDPMVLVGAIEAALPVLRAKPTTCEHLAERLARRKAGPALVQAAP